MLRVKDVNRLKAFGYEYCKNGEYTKELRDESRISVYEKDYIFPKEENIIYISSPEWGESPLIAEELFELFAANLVERVN